MEWFGRAFGLVWAAAFFYAIFTGRGLGMIQRTDLPKGKPIRRSEDTK
jgi:hypothetical protein